VDEYTKRETAAVGLANTYPPIAFTITVEKLTEPLTDDQLAEQYVVNHPLASTVDEATRSLPSARSPTTLVGVQGTRWSGAVGFLEERLYVAMRVERAYYVWFVAPGDDAASLSILEFVVASITPLQ